MSPAQPCGVRLAGTGSAVPERRLTNDGLSKILDTSDEWILQRTGIRERRVSAGAPDPVFTLSCQAGQRALDMAGVRATDLDLVIVGTVSGEMVCPSTACRVAAALGATPAGAFDVVAACCGFVYSMNLADSIIRAGRANRILVIGADAISSIVDYTDRGVSILFGDAAGAAVLERCDDSTKGCRYQTMQADGASWHHLYLPQRADIVPESDRDNPIRLGYLRMHGREVYKFAVNRFREVIEDALAKTGLTPAQISQFVCHQSNARIIESAIEKIGLPHDKVLVNIDRYGNTSAGSVGLCLDELNRAGKIPDGQPFILVAFGGGLTWASCVWNK